MSLDPTAILSPSGNGSQLTSLNASALAGGTVAFGLLPVGTASGTVAAGNDSRIIGAAQASKNLSDLASVSTARANLGLGGAAVLNVGTTTGTVAAGDDGRIVNALSTTGNGAGLTNLNASALAGGTVAYARLPIGTASNTVAAGNDSRITGAVQSTGNGSLVLVTSSSGTTPRSLASRADDQKNVIDFGGVSDCRVVTDAVSTVNSATYTSATAAFTAGDIGKVVMIGTVGDQANGYSVTGTIASVNSSTSITVGGTKAIAAKSGTGLTLSLGTDNTSALQTALDTAPAYSTVVIPAGNYAVTNAIYLRRDNLTVRCDGTISLVGHTSIGAIVCASNCENVTWTGGRVDGCNATGENAFNISGNFNTNAATTINAAKFCKNVRFINVKATRVLFDGKYVFNVNPATGTFSLGETVTGPGGFSCVINELITNSATNYRIITYALAGSIPLSNGATVTGSTSGASGTVSFIQSPAKGGKGCTIQYAAVDCRVEGLVTENCDIGLTVEAPRVNIFGLNGSVVNLVVSDVTIRNAMRCGIWLYQGSSALSMSMSAMSAVFNNVSMVDVAYYSASRPEVGIGPSNATVAGFGAISADRAVNIKMRGVKINSQYPASIYQGEGSFLDIEYEADCYQIVDPVNFNSHGPWGPGDTSPGQGVSQCNTIKGVHRSRYLNDPTRFPLTWSTSTISNASIPVYRVNLTTITGSFLAGETLTTNQGGTAPSLSVYFQDDSLLYVNVAAGPIVNGCTLTGAISGAAGLVLMPGYRTMNVTNSTGTLSTNTTLTGAASGATAILRLVSSGAVWIIENISGAFQNGETVNAASGGSAAINGTDNVSGPFSRSLTNSRIELAYFGMRYPGGTTNLVGQTNSTVFVDIYDVDGDRRAKGAAVTGLRFSPYARTNLFTGGNEIIEGVGQIGASGSNLAINPRVGDVVIRNAGGTTVLSSTAAGGVTMPQAAFTLANLTYSSTITPNAVTGRIQKLSVTNTAAFTIAAPINSAAGQTLVFDIMNASGGTMGTITWNSVFKLAGTFTNPANTKRRTIEFYFDGTNWVEVNRAANDI